MPARVTRAAAGSPASPAPKDGTASFRPACVTRPIYGPDTQYAFGHLGFTNIVAWADPERQVAAALLTSGKPLIYPQIYYAFDAVRQIGLACAKGRLPADPGASRRSPSPTGLHELPPIDVRRGR